MELLVVVVLGLLGIAAAAVLGPRLGVAAPLLLVIVGIGASLPFQHIGILSLEFHVDKLSRPLL